MIDNTHKIGIAFIVSTLFLSGCEATAPRTKFYALSSHPAISTTPGEAMNVGVGPIHFPDMLKRPQVVIRTSENTLILSETHHWGGKISEDFEYVLVENIEKNMQNSRIKAYPWDTRQRPRHQVIVTVHQFDGHPKKPAILRASWSIVDLKNRQEIFHAKEQFSKHPVRNDFEGMVSNLSAMTMELATAIANSLRQLPEAAKEDSMTRD